jgi:hypothetical protein
MPIIINELAATILPRTETVTTDRVPTQTAAPEAVRRTIELIRLAREREERLVID